MKTSGMWSTESVFCPYRGCGASVDVRDAANDVHIGEIKCASCGKKYAVWTHAVVEYETEILEDDNP